MKSYLRLSAVVVVVLLAATLAFLYWSPLSPLSARHGVALRVIVVNSADEGQQVLERIKKGETFAALAKQLSIDPTADSGGLLGRVDPLALGPALRSAVQGLKVGQLTPVVRISTGFAVLTAVPDREVGDSGIGVSLLNPALAANGYVRYNLEVAGVMESNLALKQFAKPLDWNQSPRMICDMRGQSAEASQKALERSLSSANATRAVQIHALLAQNDAYQGEMDQAIAEFEKARAAAGPGAIATQFDESIGIAYLHRSEMENGVYHEPGDRCLLGPKGIPAFAKPTYSEKALDYFSRYLSEKPNDLEVKWLLNLTYMTLGKYPAGVAPAHLIPPAALTSTEDLGRFVDVAPQAGLIAVAPAGGVIVDDFDNDGRFDVVTSTMDSCGAMHFFHREADGSFTDRAAKAGLGDQMGGGLNMIQTDFDNDGRLDILLLRGGWEQPQRRSLLRNNGDGTFVDVTAISGLARPATSTQAAVWTDINNDGFLDLFIGNEHDPAQLFLNKKDGTFVDIAEAAGVARTAHTKGVAAGDYDNDGWPDLYVSNFGGPNFLYHNNHDGTFTERAREAGAPGPGSGFATWFFDYDNDGWLDLFVANFVTSVEETARTYLRLPPNATTVKLYRNLGNGNFQDVTRQVGLDKVFMPMGANFGDIDNDGYPDIYLNTGAPSYGALVPSVLLHNKGGKSFVDITASSGTGELHKGHGVAFADLDNDGNEDIAAEIGGATPGDAHAFRLFHNPGHANDWITLKLVGRKSNRAAMGARIKVTVEDAGNGRRTIYRTVGSGGSFGASPLAQHVGLGKAARIVDVEIWWPTTKTPQHVKGIDKNQWFEITEGVPAPVKLDRPALPLGGAGEEGARVR